MVAVATSIFVHTARLQLAFASTHSPSDWPQDSREMGPKFTSQRITNLPPAHVAWVLRSLNLYLDAFCDGEMDLLWLNVRDALAAIVARSLYQGRFELTEKGARFPNAAVTIGSRLAGLKERKGAEGFIHSKKVEALTAIRCLRCFLLLALCTLFAATLAAVLNY